MCRYPSVGARSVAHRCKLRYGCPPTRFRRKALISSISISADRLGLSAGFAAEKMKFSLSDRLSLAATWLTNRAAVSIAHDGDCPCEIAAMAAVLSHQHSSVTGELLLVLLPLMRQFGVLLLTLLRQLRSRRAVNSDGPRKTRC